MNKLNLKEIGLEFQEEGHIHLLKGQEVPGCTSIASLYQDDGWKFAWPVKLMADGILERWLPDKPYTKTQIELDVKECKGLWREKRDKSADTGTKAHELIETYINTGIWKTFLDNEIKNCVENFIEWEKKYNPVWLASEIQVGSEFHHFAGIVDACAEIEGKKVLLDFKTSSSIKPEYWIQLTGLAMALEEQGWKPEVLAILHLPKEGEFEYVERPNTGQFENQFISGVAFYRHKNLFKKMIKED